MKFLSYALSLVAANMVAVLASTFVLRFKPFTWLVSNYGWSEFGINLFAFMVGTIAGLQVARFICLKVSKSEVGPIAAWTLVVPFMLLAVGEILKNNNWMGLLGLAGAIAGVKVFKGMVGDEAKKSSRQGLLESSV